MTALKLQAAAAKEAARALATAGTEQKNRALAAIADALLARQEEILTANGTDLADGKAAGMSPSLLDRLALSPARIAGIAEGVRQVQGLPDPIGGVMGSTTRPNGLRIEKRRVPLGLVGIIYEARPNVTVDAAVLCLKSGNAALLRGGKEAAHSNRALTAVMRDALEGVGLPADCICLVADTSRASATEMMGLVGYLDVLIPRGGAGLIRSVVENARVPVIETGIGICHVYVDEHADLPMAADIIVNAKVSRPSVCNAAECLLVHRAAAAEFLPVAAARLYEKGVELRGCPETRAILGDRVVPAVDADWDTEFLDCILAVKVVGDLDEAIAFVNTHGSGHSEAIVTGDATAAAQFLNGVDAAAVYLNASTRFTDGFEFGLGAEIGISTQKMHARGPMGLEELTSCKYVVYGDGQIR